MDENKEDKLRFSYEFFELKETATKGEIKKTIREYQKKYHPDICGDDLMFKQIQKNSILIKGAPLNSRKHKKERAKAERLRAMRYDFRTNIKKIENCKRTDRYDLLRTIIYYGYEINDFKSFDDLVKEDVLVYTRVNKIDKYEMVKLIEDVKQKINLQEEFKKEAKVFKSIYMAVSIAILLAMQVYLIYIYSQTMINSSIGLLTADLLIYIAVASISIIAIFALIYAISFGDYNLYKFIETKLTTYKYKYIFKSYNSPKMTTKKAMAKYRIHYKKQLVVLAFCILIDFVVLMAIGIFI